MDDKINGKNRSVGMIRLIVLLPFLILLDLLCITIIYIRDLPWNTILGLIGTNIILLSFTKFGINIHKERN